MNSFAAKYIEDELIGGQPIYFKDFKFVTESIESLIMANFGVLRQDKVYNLSGFSVEIDIGSATVTIGEGVAYYSGKLFIIKAQEVQGQVMQYPNWIESITNDSRGLKEFEEQTVGEVNCYKVRELNVVWQNTSGLRLDIDTLNHFTQKTGWEYPPLPPDWQVQDGQTVAYRKNELGHLEIKGAFYVDSTLNGFILPEEFRPNKDIYRLINTGLPATTSVPGVLFIGSNGQFTVPVQTGLYYINESFILDN